MATVIEAKRKYAMKDMADWDTFWGAVNSQVRPRYELGAGSKFLIAGVPADRAACASVPRRVPHPLRDCAQDHPPRASYRHCHLYVFAPRRRPAFTPNALSLAVQAAWRDNQKISDNNVLVAVLTAAGFPGAKLITDVTTGPKSEVSLHTQRRRWLFLPLIAFRTEHQGFSQVEHG